jgi:ATP-dependent Lhr-like helicase
LPDRPAEGAPAVVAATPVAIFPRAHSDRWGGNGLEGNALSPDARRVVEFLARKGASFDHEISSGCSLDAAAISSALGQLVGGGCITSDGFGGLRGLIGNRTSRGQVVGRWSLLRRPAHGDLETPAPGAVEERTEFHAWLLLRRYGVVFRRLLTREPGMPPWRELARVYRRFEARGEIRGGRFVSGMSGEQFALPPAVERLREVRRTAPDGKLLTISAADPLNLTGIVTAGDRIRAQSGTRVVYKDGVPLAALEGDFLRPLTEVPADVGAQLATVLAGRPLPPISSGYVGRTI